MVLAVGSPSAVGVVWAVGCRTGHAGMAGRRAVGRTVMGTARPGDTAVVVETHVVLVGAVCVDFVPVGRQDLKGLDLEAVVSEMTFAVTVVFDRLTLKGSNLETVVSEMAFAVTVLVDPLALRGSDLEAKPDVSQTACAVPVDPLADPGGASAATVCVEPERSAAPG